MTSTRMLLIPLVLAAVGCGAGPAAAPSPGREAAAPLRVVGYYAGGTAARGYTPTDIPAEAVTHVNYAFAGIAPDGTLAYRDRCIDLGECAAGEEPVAGWEGAVAGLRALKSRHPHLRVLVSIGGWGGSG
ncbi:MAG: hypothetical protein GWN02_17240, partial [Gemmatimonadetes bacterium]|nr:hypothetical protein [Gemmatimonadota bacterium]